MVEIAFIFNEEIVGSDLREKPLGGIATSIIMLAEAFVRKNNSVTIFNLNHKESVYEGVKYSPISQLKTAKAELVIANNSANDLWLIRGGIGVVWQHNRTSLSRIWKRAEILALLIKRPHLVVLSHDAHTHTPKFIPYRHAHVIPHAIESMFMHPDKSNLNSRNPRAFFASRASRNLAWVIDVWKYYIYPHLPNAEFIVCTPPGSHLPYDTEELKTYNITYKGSLPKQQLADLMNTCKVLAYPGHINETGCQVALQAIGMGIPIVTCGHGSLKDLVQHDVNGYIETDMKRYADHVIRVLTDQDLWLRLHETTLQHPWRKDYDTRAIEWLKAFNLY